MGAWGVGAFENDMALEWVAELEESEGLELVEQAFDAVLDGDGTQHDDACAIAIAAAEVLAALAGHPDEKLPDEARAWLDQQDGPPPATLLQRALEAIDAIEADSELRTLWEDSDAPEAWFENLEALRSCLRHE